MKNLTNLTSEVAFDLAIVCAGGYGKEVCDSSVRFKKDKGLCGETIFLDDCEDQISSNRGGSFSKVISIEKFIQSQLVNKFVCVIAVGEPSVRESLFHRLIAAKVNFTTIIDPTSSISTTAKIRNGVIIGPFVSIQADVYISDNAAVNSAAVVGHDAFIGAHSVISSQANIGGGVSVGASAYIGMGALIKEGVNIGSNVIIGMGSVVYNDIPEGVIALGNPARVVQKNSGKRVFK